MPRRDRIRRNAAVAAAIACAAIASPSNAQQTIAPYESNFHVSVGPEWSRDNSYHLLNGTRVLGRFTNTTVTLTLGITPGQPHALVFDLYCLDSWDGNSTQWGPDWFIVTIDGITVLRETFGAGSGHSFPGWPGVWNIELGSSSRYDDDVYQNMFFEFTPSTDTVTISFRGENLQGVDDESWCLDRVRVLPLADAQHLRPLFREVGRQIGFGVRRTNSLNNGSGMHWADLNADGFLDCFITGDESSAILLNLAAGRFTETPLSHNNRSLVRQAALVDLNADGILDIVAVPSSYDTIVAFINDGDASFTQIDAPIMPSPRNTEALAVLDLNRDGRPDVLALSGNTGNWAAVMSATPGELPAEAPGLDYGFADAGQGSYCSVADANNDGIPDLFYHLSTGMFIASQQSDRWRRHDQGIRSDALNNHKAGSAWADYDNDGRFDLFLPDPRPGHSGRLWRNRGGSFEDVTQQAGLIFNARQRSAAWGDYDNDGHLDLYIACEGEPAALFRNRGDGTFERIPNDIANCTTSGFAHHAVWVDYNNDGNLDLAITNQRATALLYQNLARNDRYLLVETKTPSSMVKLYDQAGNFLAQRLVGNPMGFAGIEPMRAHFGGINPAATYRVELITPDGRSMTRTVVPRDAMAAIGGTVIPQMVVMLGNAAGDPRRRRVASWHETQPDAPN